METREALNDVVLGRKGRFTGRAMKDTVVGSIFKNA
jgi:hypothetical protein